MLQRSCGAVLTGRVILGSLPGDLDLPPPSPLKLYLPSYSSASKPQAMPRLSKKIHSGELARIKRCRHHFPLHLSLLAAANNTAEGRTPKPAASSDCGSEVGSESEVEFHSDLDGALGMEELEREVC